MLKIDISPNELEWLQNNLWSLKDVMVLQFINLKWPVIPCFELVDIAIQIVFLQVLRTSLSSSTCYDFLGRWIYSGVDLLKVQ